MAFVLTLFILSFLMLHIIFLLYVQHRFHLHLRDINAQGRML